MPAALLLQYSRASVGEDEVSVGVPVLRDALPMDLYDALTALTKQYANGETTESGEGQARRLLFPDGTAWFPEGLQKDNGYTLLALVTGLATFALAMSAFSAAAARSPTANWLGLGALTMASICGWLIWRSSQASQRADQNIAMGTLALPEHLLLVAYEEVTVIPRARIQKLKRVTTRSNEHRSVRLHAEFLDDDGASQQRYLGFVFGSKVQQQELAEAQEWLEDWLKQGLKPATASASPESASPESASLESAGEDAAPTSARRLRRKKSRK